jgi:hypothetical protein
VNAIERVHRNGHAIWTVDVTDAHAAEAQLLRLLLSDEAVVVSDFRRKDNELEEVFLDVVKRG